MMTHHKHLKYCKMQNIVNEGLIETIPDDNDYDNEVLSSTSFSWNKNIY